MVKIKVKVMKKYVLIFSSILLFSCNSERSSVNQNINSIDISLNTWILDDKEVKSLLSDYIRSVSKYSRRKNSIIHMRYSIINGNTYSFYLWENIDIKSFINSPPYIIFQYKKRLVCFYIDGFDIFRINNDFIVKFMKKNYPIQYDYYLKYGDYPPPITGGGPLEWELIFQNDRLIRKMDISRNKEEKW